MLWFAKWRNSEYCLETSTINVAGSSIRTSLDIQEREMTMKNCLVIIDVQRGFLSSRTRQVPPRIKALIEQCSFDHIVATRFRNSLNSPYVQLLGWTGLMQPREQALHDIVLDKAERIFTKKGYTCFSPAFNRFIREKKIGKLIICGIDTDCCVLKSAIDAFERGIECDVVCDCCASNGGIKSHNSALLVLKRSIGPERLRMSSDFQSV